MPPYVRIGRHRAPGLTLRVAFPPGSPRHTGTVPRVRTPRDRTVEMPRVADRPDRTRQVFVAVIAVLLLVNVVLLELRVRQSGGGARGAALPLPTISLPAPPTVLPGPARTLSPARAVRRAAKPRPTTAPPAPTPSRSATPVLLGPADLLAWLTSYCRSEFGPVTAAVVTADGWVCARLFARARTIDLDAACRSGYGSAAWAGMLDDNDEQSWRCYRDGT